MTRLELIRPLLAYHIHIFTRCVSTQYTEHVTACILSFSLSESTHMHSHTYTYIHIRIHVCTYAPNVLVCVCTQPSLERDSFLASPAWSRRSTGANTEAEEEVSVILGCVCMRMCAYVCVCMMQYEVCVHACMYRFLYVRQI